MMTLESQKICSKCNLPLPVSLFYPDKSKKTGYKSSCKHCISKKNKKTTKPLKANTGLDISIDSENRLCNSCNNVLNVSQFYHSKNRVVRICIDCQKQKRRNRYNKNKQEEDPSKIQEKGVKNLSKCLESFVQLSVGLKKCKCCTMWKEFTQFKKRNNSLSGRASTCNICSEHKREKDEKSEAYKKARKALDERNQRIMKLTLKNKGIIK
jgi:hypothetical protein